MTDGLILAGKVLGNIPQIPKERTSSVRLRDGTSLIFLLWSKAEARKKQQGWRGETIHN